MVERAGDGVGRVGDVRLAIAVVGGQGGGGGVGAGGGEAVGGDVVFGGGDVVCSGGDVVEGGVQMIRMDMSRFRHVSR